MKMFVINAVISLMLILISILLLIAYVLTENEKVSKVAVVIAFLGIMIGVSDEVWFLWTNLPALLEKL